MTDKIPPKMHSNSVVLTKFPHYKAIYRLAQEEYLGKNYRLCLSLLFDRLLLPGGSKKRAENLLRSSIFENICEIARADIDRSVTPFLQLILSVFNNLLEKMFFCVFLNVWILNIVKFYRFIFPFYK
jgi:hypothetical protein